MKTLFKVKSTDTDGILKASRKLAEESAEFYGEQPEALVEQYTQSLAVLATNLEDIGDEYIYAIMEGHRGGWSNEEMNKQPTSAVMGLNGEVVYGYEEDASDLGTSDLIDSLDIPEELASTILATLKDSK